MSVRRYRIGHGQRDQVVQMVDDGWTDQLRAEPGFLSYYVAATADDELISITTCIDEDALSRVILKSGEWVGTHLTALDVTLEEGRQGKVVSHLG